MEKVLIFDKTQEVCDEMKNTMNKSIKAIFDDMSIFDLAGTDSEMFGMFKTIIGLTNKSFEMALAYAQAMDNMTIEIGEIGNISEKLNRMNVEIREIKDELKEQKH